MINIYLIDQNPEICIEWETRNIYPNIEIINNNLSSFLTENSKKKFILISPGNSFGDMDGGYDLSIINYFGKEVQKNVKQRIEKEFNNFLPVNYPILIVLDKNNKMIYCPTMIYPNHIKDYSIIFQVMYTSLVMVKKEKINNIIIPALGGGTGGAPSHIIAKQMFTAIDMFLNGLDKKKIINIM